MNSINLLITNINDIITWPLEYVVFNEAVKYNNYICLSIIVYYVIYLLVIAAAIIISVGTYLHSENLSVLHELYLFHSVVMCCITLPLTVNLIVGTVIENNCSLNMYPLSLSFHNENNNLGWVEPFVSFTTTYSDTLLLLCLIMGIIYVEWLGPNDLLESMYSICEFYASILITTVMVTTNNLLVLSICFYLTLLLIIYCVYGLNYFNNSEPLLETLSNFILTGPLLVSCSLGYIYYKFGTLNCLCLTQEYFSENENFYFFISFLMGFVIIIPLVVLYLHLVNPELTLAVHSHLEEPDLLFSVFLVGFLFNAGVYALLVTLETFNPISLYTSWIPYLVYSVAIIVVVVAISQDIENVIFWAVMYQISFICTFFLANQICVNPICAAYMLFDGLTGLYTLYLLKVLNERFSGVCWNDVNGVDGLYPSLTNHLIFAIFLLSGIPIGLVFYSEEKKLNLITLYYEIWLDGDRFMFLTYIVLLNLSAVLFFFNNIFSFLFADINIPMSHNFLDDWEDNSEDVLIWLICGMTIAGWLAFAH